jgi:hypothetical protein
MKRYQGIKDDVLERGGAYKQNSTDSWICNSPDVKGALFGFVEVNGRINIERLGAKNEDKSILCVTVIRAAGSPDGATVIIG